VTRNFGFGFGFGMLRLSVSVSVSVQTKPKFRYFGFGLNSGFGRSLPIYKVISEFSNLEMLFKELLLGLGVLKGPGDKFGKVR
jgi:hypothetical protein